MMRATFLGTIELIFMQLIERHGLDANAFKRLAGVDATRSIGPRTRTSTATADLYFKQAMTLIPDSAFALDAAECWHPSNLGALGYAWLSSATLQTGLERLLLYSRILGQKASFRCVKSEHTLRYIYDNPRDDLAIRNVMADFILAIVIDMCRKNAGLAFRTDKVRLQRPQPIDTKPYTDFFRCEVLFDADEDSFELNRQIADSPLPSSNQELAITFDAILAEQLAALDRTNIAAQCKVHLLQQLTSGEPSELALAEAMNISTRTLQRRLSDEAASYSQVLDELRHDLAQNYLLDSQRSMSEITFLLGFSEQSAFTRAFKRWHGKTPSAYRAECPKPD